MTTSFPVSDAAAEAALAAIEAATPALNVDGGALSHVTNFPTALPLPTGAAADGTDATGVTILTGGVGIRGWLSSIYSAITSATQKFALQPTFTPTGNSSANSIATANTDQTILASNATRRFLMIQNTNAAAPLIVSLNGVSTVTTGAPNITLQAGQFLMLDTAVPNTEVHAQSPLLGATYTIVEG